MIVKTFGNFSVKVLENIAYIDKNILDNETIKVIVKNITPFPVEVEIHYPDKDYSIELKPNLIMDVPIPFEKIILSRPTTVYIINSNIKDLSILDNKEYIDLLDYIYN